MAFSASPIETSSVASPSLRLSSVSSVFSTRLPLNLFQSLLAATRLLFHLPRIDSISSPSGRGRKSHAQILQRPIPKNVTLYCFRVRGHSDLVRRQNARTEAITHHQDEHCDIS